MDGMVLTFLRPKLKINSPLLCDQYSVCLKNNSGSYCLELMYSFDTMGTGAAYINLGYSMYVNKKLILNLVI